MKVLSSKDAIEMISEGSILMIGGFLGCGTPEKLIDELIASGKKGFTVIANDTAFPDKGIGKLIVSKLVNKVIASHIGTNPETQRQMIEGELEVELVPQGTLAERVRGGGVGLGGILTPTGVGTVVEDGKQKVVIADKEYLLELVSKHLKPINYDRWAELYWKKQLEGELTAKEEKELEKQEKENLKIIEGVYNAFLNDKEIMDLIGKIKSHHWVKVIEGG